MIAPSQDVVVAVGRLHHNSDFRTVAVWLRESYEAELEAMCCASPESVLVAQGRSQVLKTLCNDLKIKK